MRTSTDKCMYSINLIATLYEPLLHKRTVMIYPSYTPVDIGIYAVDVVNAHKVYDGNQLTI